MFDKKMDLKKLFFLLVCGLWYVPSIAADWFSVYDSKDAPVEKIQIDVDIPSTSLVQKTIDVSVKYKYRTEVALSFAKKYNIRVSQDRFDCVNRKTGTLQQSLFLDNQLVESYLYDEPHLVLQKPSPNTYNEIVLDKVCFVFLDMLKNAPTAK